jgi:hypothetical protein
VRSVAEKVKEFANSGEFRLEILVLIKVEQVSFEILPHVKLPRA